MAATIQNVGKRVFHLEGRDFTIMPVNDRHVRGDPNDVARSLVEVAADSFQHAQWPGRLAIRLSGGEVPADELNQWISEWHDPKNPEHVAARADVLRRGGYASYLAMLDGPSSGNEVISSESFASRVVGYMPVRLDASSNLKRKILPQKVYPTFGPGPLMRGEMNDEGYDKSVLAMLRVGTEALGYDEHRGTLDVYSVPEDAELNNVLTDLGFSSRSDAAPAKFGPYPFEQLRLQHPSLVSMRNELLSLTVDYVS